MPTIFFCIAMATADVLDFIKCAIAFKQLHSTGETSQESTANF